MRHAAAAVHIRHFEIKCATASDSQPASFRPKPLSPRSHQGYFAPRRLTRGRADRKRNSVAAHNRIAPPRLWYLQV